MVDTAESAIRRTWWKKIGVDRAMKAAREADLLVYVGGRLHAVE